MSKCGDLAELPPHPHFIPPLVSLEPTLCLSAFENHVMQAQGLEITNDVPHGPLFLKLKLKCVNAHASRQNDSCFYAFSPLKVEPIILPCTLLVPSIFLLRYQLHNRLVEKSKGTGAERTPHARVALAWPVHGPMPAGCSVNVRCPVWRENLADRLLKPGVICDCQST